MAKNDFNIRRIAFGHWTFPANTGTNTASTLSANCNVYVPKGAIVTGIRHFVAGAITNVSAIKNGTVNVLIGGQAIGTNNQVASAALSAASTPVIQTLSVTAGVYVSAGGNMVINFASSDSDRSAVAGTGDVYVEYLYCPDYDLT